MGACVPGGTGSRRSADGRAQVSSGKESTRQWTRTKPWAAVGLLVLAAATTVMIAGTAGARGDGRGPAGFPASVWTGATWQEATVAERRSYVLGITDGLRLAAVFHPAQVNLNPVAPCVPRLSAEPLTRRVGGHLDGLALKVDAPTLHCHVWDALVATCRDDARTQ
jgi:hypothetical protein